MQTLTDGYRGMSLILTLNWDRILYLFTVGFALFMGAYLGAYLQ
ncbi:MAG: hypothetical protein N4A61_15455 [Pelagimonas sp.]|jgi:hypothetical protein|nr:hypothetical protein [Pelagimonas sp.]